MILQRLTRPCWIVTFILVCSLQMVAVFGQSPAPTPSPTPSVSPSPTPSQQGDPDRYLREGLKGIADESQTLIGWGLAIIGASVIAIASTSYFRPTSKKMRLVYLLFIPGWFFMALSIWNGEKISRRHAAAAFTQNRQTLREIGTFVHQEFGNQLTYMQVALAFFSLWLVSFTLWWILADAPTSKTTKGEQKSCE